MKEINVKYLLSDDEINRLAVIRNKYKDMGYNFTIEQLFSSIMITGSKYNIEDKLKFHEWKTDIRKEL